MITNEEARKAVETLKEHVDQQLDCCNCIFNNNMLASDFCDRYFKACLCDWNLKILKKKER